MLDDERLDGLLDDAFQAAERERAVVIRQAVDLADAGSYRADSGHELTAELVVDNLVDAPAGLSLPERWNWWIGALELAYGDYERFRIDRWRSG